MYKAHVKAMATACVFSLFCLPSSALPDMAIPTDVHESMQVYAKLGINAEQANKIQDLVNANKKLVSDLDQQIDNLRQEITLLFLTPDPDQAKLFATQQKIDAFQLQQDTNNIKTTLEIRKVLTPTQRQLLVWGNPASVLPQGIKITAEQEKKYQMIFAKFLDEVATYDRQIDNLEFDKSILYQPPNLNTQALLAKQAEINQINNAIENAKIKLIVDTRNILTKQERVAYFNRHHPKIWNDTGINQKQSDDIMAIHTKLEEADRIGRRQMINIADEIAKLYQQPMPDETLVMAKQIEYDRVQAETTNKQLKCLIENRTILTPGQRKKLVELMRINQGLSH